MKELLVSLLVREVRRLERFGRTPRTIASPPQRLAEPGDIAIRSISQYHRDNEYLEALMI
jgi:hypothetical protein